MSDEIAPYAFQFEIAGPMAMFTRPDTGSVPVSYPIPTGSALKAMAESLAFVKGAAFRPLDIKVCSPVRYARYATNYGGPGRKSGQRSGNSNYQLFATVLIDVCFRVYGECVRTHEEPKDDSQPCVKLASMLQRRMDEGQSRYPVSLGWKEFGATYFGPFRDGITVCRDVDAVVDGYLLSPWSQEANGRWSPRLRTVQIVEGHCDLREAWQ